MTSNKLREVFVSCRATDDEIAIWDQAWRKQGYKSRSQFMRQSICAAAVPGLMNMKTVEESFHLNRISAVLMELRTLVAVNDNMLSDTNQKMLGQALEHVLAISKET